MSRYEDPKTVCRQTGGQCALLDELRREIDTLKQECKKLHEMSHMDMLTGYYNLRHLLKALDGEMERTKRTGLPTGFIIIDLDNFKQINDHHGHEFGNKVIQWSCRIWKNSIRRIDIPCRYGGEEFAIILPNTPLEGTMNVAERLRAYLAESPLTVEDTTIHVTASFGVDVYTGEDDLAPEDFIHQADQFLLQAKQSGKNRIKFNKNKIIKSETEISPAERDVLFGNPSNGDKDSPSDG
ncbi:MAG: GGDEF domain-containing protein [Thermodesulfobacteriota bacterium]|nr:GGDEF domain-containing protein [Thermodesulfobacteriota bacterium]